MSTVSTSERSSKVVFLDWQQEDDSVTVTPRDQDRFNLKMQKAVEMLQLARQADFFKAELAILMDELATWLKGQAHINRAYLTIHDSRLLFVVVRDTVEYDEEFEDALSAIDWKIANDGDLTTIKMHALSLPKSSDEAVDSFLHPTLVIAFPVPQQG